mmetsp:Transcript_11674/g.11316  ORF Transcript_11674/g.11316 Transcript_11674/m.11316 type:complete len:441 (+) Transcript_11674:382-1704(+)
MRVQIIYLLLLTIIHVVPIISNSVPVISSDSYLKVTARDVFVPFVHYANATEPIIVVLYAGDFATASIQSQYRFISDLPNFNLLESAMFVDTSTYSPLIPAPVPNKFKIDFRFSEVSTHVNDSQCEEGNFCTDIFITNFDTAPVFPYDYNMSIFAYATSNDGKIRTPYSNLIIFVFPNFPCIGDQCIGFPYSTFGYSTDPVTHRYDNKRDERNFYENETWPNGGFNLVGSNTTISSSGGDTIVISGHFFGQDGLHTYDTANQVALHRAVTYSQIYGNNITYTAENCFVFGNGSRIQCVTPPGIGNDLYWQVSFGSLDTVHLLGPSYSPPILTSIVPNIGGNRYGGDSIHLYGSGFDPSLTSKFTHLFFGEQEVLFYAITYGELSFILPRINESVVSTYNVSVIVGGQSSTNIVFSYRAGCACCECTVEPCICCTCPESTN